jgi:Putative auto-transporter adhesin, head GIN domain
MRLLPNILALTLTGCGLVAGSGNVITTTRDLGASTFSRVSVATGISVKAQPGPREVVVRADDNLQDLVSTAVEGDTLVIKLQPGTVLGVHAALEVDVTNEALEAIEASGGARGFVIATPAASFVAVATGGSTIEAKEIVATDLAVEGSGGSAVTLSGVATTGTAVATGGSDLDLREVPLESLQVDASGGSTVRARVSSMLTGAASGGSTVLITGTPQRSVDTSGGSEVRTGAQ